MRIEDLLGEGEGSIKTASNNLEVLDQLFVRQSRVLETFNQVIKSDIRKLRSYTPESLSLDKFGPKNTVKQWHLILKYITAYTRDFIYV